MTNPQKPLSHIRVLDLSRILAAPFSAQTLADLGAEVIKVERPGVGDDSRRYGPPFLKDLEGKDTDYTPMFLAVNRGKKSITIDLSKPEGQELVKRLAATSDVLVENYKVGDLKRYGLDYESIKAINPRIVYCSITGFGQTGPYKDRPGYDSIFQAMSGLMGVTGFPSEDPVADPSGHPLRVGMSITDVVGGMQAATAIITALYHRDHTSGIGQHLDVAILDTSIAMLTHIAMSYSLSGVIPRPRGNTGNGAIPSGLFKCSDGALTIVVGNDVQFVRMCQALNHPEIATDARFARNASRVVNRLALTAIMEDIFKSWTLHDLIEAMVAVSVPAAPVNTMEDVFNDPHVNSRGMIVDIPHPSAGHLKLIGHPIRYSETPAGNYAAPPELGANTDEVLRDVLGMDAAAIAALRDSGCV